MELRHLRYFKAVAESLNFTRAAASLRVAQPALSRQIRALEEELGAPLFDRDHGVQLTDAGRLFHRHVTKILGHVEVAVAAVREVTTGESGGELIVCNDWRLAGQFVPAVMDAFQRKFPHVAVTLQDLRFHDQLTALRARRAHLGFVVRSVVGRAGELETLLVLRARLLVVLPARHPRAEEGQVSLADLALEKWVTLDEKEAPGYRAFIGQLARISGFTPQFGPSATTVEGLLGRVAMGYGVALTLENAAPLHNPLLRCLATDIEPLELCAVWHRREKSPLLHALLNIIREQVSSGTPANAPRPRPRRLGRPTDRSGPGKEVDTARP